MTSPSFPARSGFPGHLAACVAAAGLDNIFRVAIGSSLTAAAMAQAQAGSAEAGREAAESLVGWVMILFTLPFILCAPTAGALGDRLPKHLIIRAARVLDALALAVGLTGLGLGSTPLMLTAITLLATISAFFAPVKLAVVPELVAQDRLPQANAWLAALTVVAILGGTAIAALHDPLTLSHLGLGSWDPLLVLGLAAGLVVLLGLWGAWRIPPLAALAPQQRLSWHRQVGALLRAVHGPGIGVPAWCLALFWAAGAVAMVGLTAIAGTVYGLRESAVATLSLVLAIGLILGSVAAPLAMHRAYPAGLPILGAFLTGGGMLGAGLSTLQVDVHALSEAERFSSALATLGPWMLLCGCGGGLWEVPLTVLLQERAPPQERNLVMAGVTVLANAATVGLVLALEQLTSAATARALGHPLHYQHCWLLLGGTVLAGAALLLAVYRLQVAGWLIAIATRLAFRVRVSGLEHLPATGGCLLVCNHLSYADGLVIAAVLPRRPRFLSYRRFVDMPLVGFALRAAGAIPIAAEDHHRSLVASIDAAVDAAAAGELVVIFPEGMITRDGATGVFKKGLERIASRAGVRVLPARLDGLWGGLWSMAPRRRPLLGTVRLRLGPTLPMDVSAEAAQQAVLALAPAAMGPVAGTRPGRDR